MANEVEDDDNELLSIALSDSEDAGSEPRPQLPQQQDKHAQSEAEFQAVRSRYRVKIENGEIWKQVKLPLSGPQISKPQVEEVLHAVEELYFFRRYDEALAFTRRALLGFSGDEDEDEDEVKKKKKKKKKNNNNKAVDNNEELAGKLRVYEAKCLAKINGG